MRHMKFSEFPDTENAKCDARKTDTGAWPA